jgi:hypothetical protein
MRASAVMLKPLLLKGKEDRIMKWFTKEEVIRCYRKRKEDRCKECRLTQEVKRLPNGLDENMEALVTEVMDPAREKLGKPIICNSGFRCPIHNAKVGGATGSQHMKGEAMDIAPAGLQVTAYGLQELERLARIIVANGKFDQLIVYPTFLHVSWKRQGGNRKQILRKTATGYQKVERL